MRLFLILLTTSFLFVNCSNKSDTYAFKGDAHGFSDNTKIVVFTFNKGQSTPIDTLIIKNAKFSGYLPRVQEPVLNFLRIENENFNPIFFAENKDLHATIYKDSLSASRVSGSPQNDSYNSFLDKALKIGQRSHKIAEETQMAAQAGEMDKIPELQIKQMNLQNEETELRRNFIEKNRNSLFSIMLIGEMMSQENLTSKQAKEYLDNLDASIANHDMAIELRKALERMGSGEIGAKAPDFSGPTPDGNILSLSEVLGKYTIIDFWASWCMPCRVENPNVVKAYRKYHDKGLNIISVSLDRPGARDAWLEAIKKDEMEWYHISNLEFWNDPIAKEYGIRAIPATFLLDENGIIIDKNLRGAALEAKLATLFAD